VTSFIRLVCVRAVFSFLMVLYASALTATPYQSEVGARYKSVGSDASDRITTVDVAGVYYLSPIDEVGPLAEAAFLAKASYIGGSISNLNTGVGPASSDGQATKFFIGFLLPIYDLYVESEYTSQNLSGTGDRRLRVDSGMSLSKFINDTVLAGFTYISGRRYLSMTDQVHTESATIYGKTLTSNIMLSGTYSMNRASSINAELINIDRAVKLDYYLDRTLSIGLEYNLNTGDDGIKAGVYDSLNVSKYITGSSQIGISYSIFSADLGNTDTAVIIDYSLRF